MQTDMVAMLTDVMTALDKLRHEVEHQTEPVCASGEPAQRHSPRLVEALREQCDKLGMLTARVQAQAAYESELRALLLHAHEELLRHDHDLHVALAALWNGTESAGELGKTLNGWTPLRPRGTGESRRLRYRQVVQRVHETVAEKVSPHATVIVVSKGDEELLKLDDRTGWHFPQTDDGTYAGHYPADSAAAIGHLEVLRARGGGFLLIPSTGFWWLEHYQDFARHLESRFACVHRDEHCLLYELRSRQTE